MSFYPLTVRSISGQPFILDAPMDVMNHKGVKGAKTSVRMPVPLFARGLPPGAAC